MFRRFFCVFMAILTLTGLIFTQACTRQEVDEGKIEILVSFYPVYIFTLNLSHNIDEISLNNMTDGRATCLHDYQLTTKDMKLLSTADLLIINGAGMEGFIQKIIENNKDLKILDSSEGIDLIKADHSNHENEHDHNHAHEVLSHIWLSVPNAIKQVENIYKVLVDLVPNQKDRLKENKDTYIKTLLDLDKDLRQDAQKLKSPIITFHGAYEYFSEEYSIPVIENIESPEGLAPSPQKLGQIKDLMLSEGVKAIFIEPNYEGTVASLLASETGAKVYTLDPITGGDNNLDAYQEAMRQNMQILSRAENE